MKFSQICMYGICAVVAPSGVIFFSGFLTHDVLLLIAPVCSLYRMDLLIRGQKVIFLSNCKWFCAGVCVGISVGGSAPLSVLCIKVS